VASPGEAGQVVHLHLLTRSKYCLPGVCGNGRKIFFLKFENFQVWVLIKLDSDAKYIFVRSKGAVLLKSYFDLCMSYE
jgi:hypothetical protein